MAKSLAQNMYTEIAESVVPPKVYPTTLESQNKLFNYFIDGL